MKPHFDDKCMDIVILLLHYNIQIWTGYEGNNAKYMPEGVWVDNYFTRP